MRFLLALLASIPLVAAFGCAAAPASRALTMSVPAVVPHATAKAIAVTPVVAEGRKSPPITWIQGDGAEDPLRLDQLPLIDDSLMAEAPYPLTEELSELDRAGAAGLQFVKGIYGDYCRYYSAETLLPLAAGLGVGAAIAHTHADQGLRDYYQASVRNGDTDDWSQGILPKPLGDGAITLPVFTAASIAGHWMADQPDGGLLGEWGDRSLRTFIVGAPPMYALQFLTGGSRPNEVDESSEWRPLADNNGVSGHSFMGAIPFLSAAMMTDDPWLKAGFYGASTLAGLSRINDDAHYTSQVLLGWWLAYLAAAAVDRTGDETNTWRVVSVPNRDGVMLGLEFRR